MSPSELNTLADMVAEKVYEKLSRKKHAAIKSEKRNRVRRDILGIQKIKKSQILK